ncbi:6-phosphofructokinase (EC [uncultured Gammaproteobacteria bacterium]|nr:6-phosphofructokinase (EC [uncultured Gammaproteobacteria bacterium]
MQHATCSKSDVEQAYALGEAAVNLAMEGKNSVMPAVIRTSNNPYTWEIGMGELKDIANVEKNDANGLYF